MGTQSIIQTQDADNISGQGGAKDSQEQGLLTREISLDLLQAVLGQKRPLDQLLVSNAQLGGLDPRDRNFVRMVVATTLRRLGQIDDLIMRALDQDRPPHPEILHHILRISVTQILFMDVPDHAAVHIGVSLAEKHNLPKQKGLINAVLRRMTAEGREWLRMQDEAHMNVPPWLLAQWIEDYGLKSAGDIAQSNLSEAALDITVKNPDIADMWASSLDGSILPTGSIRTQKSGRIEHMQGYDEGHWWVQDASAALPAQLFGDDISGQTVIDLCAAPGGKTAQFAAMGAHVIAVDRSAKRMQTLKSNIERLNLVDHVETVVSDGAEWLPQEQAPYVLVDAPCTASGTIRRHPDMPHLKTPRDQERLMDTQSRLLQHAAQMVALEGILIYCTCSLQKAEGDYQVENFLANNPGFALVPVRLKEVGGVQGIIQSDGSVRIHPYHMAAHGGMDGFYIARLQRISH